MKCPFLEEVDPSEDGNYAIRYASYNGHTDIVKLLLQDERVKDTLSKEEIEKYRNIKIWYI